MSAGICCLFFAPRSTHLLISAVLQGRSGTGENGRGHEDTDGTGLVAIKGRGESSECRSISFTFCIQKNLTSNDRTNETVKEHWEVFLAWGSTSSS